jgi:hypothetical protein
MNRPLDRVRDLQISVAGRLPSRISAFGDGSDSEQGGGEGGSRPGSIRLPSHISAFGEGVTLPGSILVTQDMALNGMRGGGSNADAPWPLEDMALGQGACARALGVGWGRRVCVCMCVCWGGVTMTGGSCAAAARAARRLVKSAKHVHARHPSPNTLPPPSPVQPSAARPPASASRRTLRTTARSCARTAMALRCRRSASISTAWVRSGGMGGEGGPAGAGGWRGEGKGAWEVGREAGR